MLKWFLFIIGIIMISKVNANYITECDKTFQFLINMKLHKGLVAFIDDGSTSIIKTYGDIKDSKDSFFEIGSLTKGITGILILEAQKAGRIDIDNPVSFYIKEFKNQEVGNVTIKELLTHTSGIRTDKRYVMFNSDPYRGFSEQKLLDEIMSTELREKKFLYSNLGVALLGVVLTRIYSKDYKKITLDFLKQIGITNMSFENKKLVKGYTYYFNESKPWDLSSVNPAGGLKSDLDSLIKLSKFFKDYHLRNNLFYPLIKDGPDISYLWGTLNNDVFAHTGKTSMHSSFFAQDKKGRTVIVLSNTADELSPLIDLFTGKKIKSEKKSFFTRLLRSL